DLKRCQILHKQFFPSIDGSGTNVEINGSPAIANGRIYFLTRDEMYCIGKPGHKAPADSVPPMPMESASDPNAKASYLQVVPADAVLHPGQSQTFKARAFDANGQFLREVKAEWSLPSPPPPPNTKTVIPPLRGQINSEGQLVVAKEMPGQQGPVVEKAGGLVGRARVRGVPTLPLTQDFEKIPLERTPGGWVNCQGKFVVVEKD